MLILGTSQMFFLLSEIRNGSCSLSLRRKSVLHLACWIRAGRRSSWNSLVGRVVLLKVWNASQIAVDYFRILRFVRVQLTVYISLRETRNTALSGVAVSTRKVMGKYCWSLLGEILGPRSSSNVNIKYI